MLARFLLFAVGVALVLLSWPASTRAGVYAAVLAGLGVLAVLQAIVGNPITKLRVGNTEMEMGQARERQAAAEVAGSGETITSKIDLAEDDHRPPEPTPLDPMVAGALNYSAGTIALQAIMDSQNGEHTALQGSVLRLYLFDPDSNSLYPVIGPDADPDPWPVGQGATGCAYRDRQFVLATGDAVWNSKYSVPEDRQDRYLELTAVAATPVFNRGQRCIGVLTATTGEHDPPLATTPGRNELVLKALLVSRVLVELLQWFDDE
jgi:hypothetical protein